LNKFFENFTKCGYLFFQAAGMKQGDFIVAIGDEDVKWAVHETVVQKIKEAKRAGSSLCLKLVTPMDRNYLKVSI
jgi:C-terminal processing protease CtpA/Prc